MHGRAWVPRPRTDDGNHNAAWDSMFCRTCRLHCQTLRTTQPVSAGDEIVVQTKDGLATIPSGNLSGSGSVLIAAEGSAWGAATGSRRRAVGRGPRYNGADGHPRATPAAPPRRIEQRDASGNGAAPNHTPAQGFARR